MAIVRFLGIDYGDRRIGLAVSDPDGLIASPVSVVDGVGELESQYRRLKPVIDDYGVEAIVIGLPLNMDDSEGPQAKLTRQFGDGLAQRTGLPVQYFDERLTSFAADERLFDAQLTRGKKKARRDAVAAQLILQSFLDARRSSSSD